MGFFSNFDKMITREEKKGTEIFKKGKEAGIREGIIIGMNRNFERSKEVSEDEYQEVMTFLRDRDLKLERECMCATINKN